MFQGRAHSRNDPPRQRFFWVRNTFFNNSAGVFESNLLNIWEKLVDRITKNNQIKTPSFKDALAQPLKLKESLKIRDGLAGHDAHPVQWAHFKATRSSISGLGYFWISNN